MKDFLTDGDLVAFDVLVIDANFGTLVLDESEKAGLVQAGWNVSNFPVSVSKREYVLPNPNDAYDNAAWSFKDATSWTFVAPEFSIFITPAFSK